MTWGRAEVMKLREAGVKGLPKGKDVSVLLSPSGTLLSTMPAGLDGPALEMLLNQAQKAAER